MKLPAPSLAGNRQAILAALLTLALLVAVTLGLWWNSSAESTQIARQRFDFKLAEAQVATQQRLLAYEQVLRGAVGLFAASEDVTRDEWATYVRTLEIEKNFLGIQGIGYSPHVLRADLAAHRQRIRGEGLADYAIQPPGERAEYAPIVFMEPADWRNARALGYDMFTDPALREPLKRAQDTGLPSVSGKVKLAQEVADGVQSGFVMCLPVFRKGAAHATIDERQAALDGYVCSTFRMGDLMQGILGPEQLPDIRLRVFDGAAAATESLMYDTLDGIRGAPPTPSFSDDRAFDFDGHQWTLRFDSLPAFDAGIDTQKPRIMLVGGLLVSVLFAAVVWSLLLNRQRARALAGLNAGLETEIAERTKLETELKRAKNAAEAANQAKSDFLANVSHELRTPLTLILAPLEQLLETGHLLPDWRTQVDRAQRNALRLMNRVNDILDFSKAEAGKFDVRPAPVDLVKMVGGLADDAALVAKGKGCALTWRIDPALGTVFLDPGHFEKILLNLVSNAIKFTPAGGTVHLEVTPLAGERFELAVRDSGIGIAPDKLPLLFQRFSQIDSSATRQYGGTGIGLALVKELAELMGGEVGVDSEPGRGSCFTVRLPLGTEQHVPAEARDIHVRTSRSTSRIEQRRLRFDDGSHGHGTDHGIERPTAEGADAEPLPGQALRSRVLVVDDSPEMLDYLGELLRDDYSVATAADGEKAWTLLQHRPIDVIVSDVMMPELDGFGLTARIKASAGFAHLPVILLTARGGSEASVSGLESGADDYIAKPFSPLELKARVRAALRMSQVQAELHAKSRQAGMAEIATNVLHNVGNVLNSVNISAGVLDNQVRASKASGLARVVQMMDEHSADLADFLTRDEKGRRLPDYLGKLAAALAAEQQSLLDEIGQLSKSVGHIKDIVATQQAYAGTVSVVETVPVRDLLEDALRMTAADLTRHQVTVVREFADLPLLPLDKHRVLQILVNLIGNAKQAMDGVTGRTHRLILRANLVDGADGRSLRVCVADDGDGIPAENLTRIFAHGFTTRKGGHGFGLHSCALAAREMGGTLTAHSDGPGQGASFTLELPLNTERIAA
ncbi:CHASE domain-containing protein [Sulfuritalea sp.]|uniref:CHASE domain-containing protein n=1 Tax=Sulfuritalea sp. TaxID=2480090 RepID=UPI00286E1193|nr:CHASE domain-containing protein [Sulfuritalea sp.]